MQLFRNLDLVMLPRVDTKHSARLRGSYAAAGSSEAAQSGEGPSSRGRVGRKGLRRKDRDR